MKLLFAPTLPRAEQGQKSHSPCLASADAGCLVAMPLDGGTVQEAGLRNSAGRWHWGDKSLDQVSRACCAVVLQEGPGGVKPLSKTPTAA